MISDWITSFSMWQTLIAASTATTVPSLPREGAAAVLLPPRRLGVLASITMSCAVGVPGGRIGTKATRTASIHLPRGSSDYLAEQVPKPPLRESAVAKDIDASLLDLWSRSCQPNGPSMPCITSWSAVSATPSNLSVRAKPDSSTADTTLFSKSTVTFTGTLMPETSAPSLQSPSGVQALIALNSQWSVGIGACDGAAAPGASAAGVSALAEKPKLAATHTVATPISR